MRSRHLYIAYERAPGAASISYAVRSCDAPCAGGGEGQLAARIELDFARQLDDCFGMTAVLEQRVFYGLGAVDEKAAIETVLFLGAPVAATVPADEDDCRCRAARG